MYGPGWIARRTADGFTLHYLEAAQGGGEAVKRFTPQEFEHLRADPAQFTQIVHAHHG